MASTPVHVFAPGGLTLTLELYTEDSDTAVNGTPDTLTEQTNRKGLYVATVTEALSGLHYAVVKNAGGDALVTGVLMMEDTTDVQRLVDPSSLEQTIPELSAVPSATPKLLDKITWMFMLARNKITQTNMLQTLRNDADDGDVATATISDDGTTATREEFS